uniref:Calcineurin-like phosphoesterase domain-containing protein n=1 Tax=Magallana gigas TaxID=29159 RepID=K1R919_MAGGI
MTVHKVNDVAHEPLVSGSEYKSNNMALPMEDGSSVVILLVADPQIQGYQFEGSIIGPFARWDADNYLRKTFSFAAAHTKPDIVIFLGDLMDEGSQATPNEYRDTYYRFLNIFSHSPNVKRIYIPGDNDIGGEYRDYRTPQKVDRFEKHFEQVDGIIRHEFVDFIKPVAYICNDCMRQDDFSWSVHQRDLTHMHGFMFENISRSAECLTEIMVPTCSYRMGEPHMGYGVAVLDKNGGLHYGILWNPNRYRVLYSYIIVWIFVILVNVICFCCPGVTRCFGRRLVR